MSMARAELITALREALGAAADKVSGDLDRPLDDAADALSRYRPRIAMDSLTLEPGRVDYPAPSDLLQVQETLWGVAERARLRPWDPGYPKRLPRLSVRPGPAGAAGLMLTPPPLAEDIAALGADYRYTYRARHTIADDAAATTVPAADRDLLILRAMAGVMHELAAAGTVARVQLNRGTQSAPTSATPAHVAAELFARFEREVRR